MLYCLVSANKSYLRKYYKLNTMDKIKQIVLICENGNVITDDGTKFQVTEVKSETVAPDYSHLIGKWVRCKDDFFNSDYFEMNKWYECVKVINETCFISDKNGRSNGVVDSVVYLDLNNPLDYNPTELVGKYYKGVQIESLCYANGKPFFFTNKDDKDYYCSDINLSEVTDTPPTKSLKYEDVAGEVKPLCFVNNEGDLRTHVYYNPKHSALNVPTERDAKKLRATAQLLVVMHAANKDWVWDEEQKCYGIYYSLTHKNHPIIEYELTLPQIYFRTRELAEKALADNKQLFNEYFGIDE